MSDDLTKELAACAAECANALQKEISARYPPEVTRQPGMMRRYESELAPVRRARAAYAEYVFRFEEEQ